MRLERSPLKEAMDYWPGRPPRSVSSVWLPMEVLKWRLGMPTYLEEGGPAAALGLRILLGGVGHVESLCAG